jgi:triacylglycerol lipase
VTQVSPVNSSYVRGEELLAQVENILAQTGKAKVHLIGHSQGGLDARYVAGMRPDLVRSVTTVATPNQGADLAGFISGEITADGTIGGALLGLFGGLLEDFARLITGSTDPLDWKAGFGFLSDVGAFNATFPEGLPASGCGDGASSANGVRFYSWTGDVVGFLGTRISTNVLDPSDLVLNTASLFYGLFEDNDGLVTVCSSRFGESLGEYTMNHLDEVNQMVGLVSPLETNPKTVFRTHAQRILALAP